jgi:uncharacterized membrane protein (UPF0127 family)
MEKKEKKKPKLKSMFWKMGLLIFISIIFLFYDRTPKLPEDPTVCFDETCFIVEVADTFYKRYGGLSFRVYLEQDKGMVFPFERERDYPFWMKNMNFPLDIIFINKEKEVRFIAPDVQPCVTEQCPNIRAGEPIMYVLELNAGTAGEMNLKVGDVLEMYISHDN